MTQKGLSNDREWFISKLFHIGQQRRGLLCVGLVFALWSLAPFWVRADQVELQNGERYVGTVLSLNADTLLLQNEILGTIQVPRSKVAQIKLGTLPATGTATLPPRAASKERAPSTAPPVADPKSSAALSQLGAHTNMIRQIQKQFLADAGPEANQKFDELLNGLLSGKLSMNDLRAQAQSAVNQLKELKRQGGDDAGFATDTYLTILDHFLKEMPSSGSMTNLLDPSTTSKPDSAQPQE